MIGLLIKLSQHHRRDCLAAVRPAPQPDSTVAVIRMKSAIEINAEFAVIVGNLLKTLVIIDYPPGEIVGDQFPVKKLCTGMIDHFGKNNAGLLIRIGFRKHLTVGKRMIGRSVILDIGHCYRLDPPGVVYQNFRVDPERFIKKLLIKKTAQGDVGHGFQACPFQFPRFACSDLPEIRQRLMTPEQISVTVFVQLRNSDTVLICRSFFRDNIHGNLGQIEIGADSNGCGDPCASEHIPDHGDSHEMGRLQPAAKRLAFISIQIPAAVNEAFIDAVNVNILRRNVFQIYFMDFCGDTLIFRHARNRDNIVNAGVVPGLIQANGLPGLKQAGPGRNPDCFQGRGDRQADGLIGTVWIRNKEIGPQRIQTPRNAFNGCIIAFEINAEKRSAHWKNRGKKSFWEYIKPRHPPPYSHNNLIHQRRGDKFRRPDHKNR